MLASIKKSFAIGMLILGAILGAGFASGRELASFFGLGASPIFLSLATAALIFLSSALFLFIGSKLNAKTVTDVNVVLIGRFHFAADAFLLVNSLIVLAAMLGAVNSLGASVIAPLGPLYAVILGITCALLAIKGAKGLIIANKIVSPLMIAALIFIGLFTVATVRGEGISLQMGGIWLVVVYVAMNMMLASTVVTTLGKIDKQSILLSSAIAAVSMGVLVFILMHALNVWGDASADMPILDMALNIHASVHWIMVVLLAAGIFTTMLVAMSGLVAWFESFFGSKLFTAFIVLALAFILSNLGFATVVRVLYPIIGVVGVIYIIIASTYAVRTLPVFSRHKKNQAQ